MIINGNHIDIAAPKHAEHAVAVSGWVVNETQWGWRIFLRLGQAA